MLITIVFLSYHFIWFGSFFYVYWIEGREKNKRIFSVTVPKEKQSDTEVQKIIKNYRKKMKYYGIAGCLSAILYFFPSPYIWIKAIVLSIIIIIVPWRFAKAAREKMWALKRKEVWSKQEGEKKRKFDVQLDWRRINRMIPWYIFVFPLIIHIGIVMWEIFYYGHIQIVGMISLLLISVTLIFLVFIYHLPNHTYCQDHSKNEELNIRRKMLWTENMLDLLIPECIFLVWMEIMNWMPIWFFWLGIGVHCIIICGTSFRFIKRTSEFLHIESSWIETEKEFVYDEDEFWYYGIFGLSYKNPYDPELFKSNGSNTSQTVNIARPIVKQVSIVFLIVLVIFFSGIFIYPKYLDSRHQLAEICLTETEVQIDGAFYKKKILIEDIQSVTLLDELMPMVRVWGTATGAYLSGKFELENGERFELYVARKHLPYILIITKENKKIIFNDDEEDKTRKCYEELKLRNYGL